MKHYDEIIAIQYGMIRELLIQANDTFFANLTALNSFFIERDGKTPICSPYFKVREENSRGYEHDGNTECAALAYWAVWSYKIGEHNGYQDMSFLYGGHCNHVLYFGCHAAIHFTKKGHKKGYCSSDTTVYVGESENQKSGRRIKINTNGVECPLNPITFAETVQLIDQTYANLKLVQASYKFLEAAGIKTHRKP